MRTGSADGTRNSMRQANVHRLMRDGAVESPMGRLWTLSGLEHGGLCCRHRRPTSGRRDMQRSATRIRTSHVGRRPPPKAWDDVPARLANPEITDPAVTAAQVTPAIAETVRRQAEIEIDCIADGE